MRVLHKTKEPGLWILAGLLETIPGRAALLLANCVATNAIDRKLSFVFCQPASDRRIIGKEKKAEDGDQSGDGALDDEEPECTLATSLSVCVWKRLHHCQPAMPFT